MKALSVRWPWSSMLVCGCKPIENRTRRTNVRGWVLIHSGLQEDYDACWDHCRGTSIYHADFKVRHILRTPDLGTATPLGGIIGAVRIVDCVDSSDSPWFVGPFGYVIDRALELPFYPCKGSLGFFNVELPPALEALIPQP